MNFRIVIAIPDGFPIWGVVPVLFLLGLGVWKLAKVLILFLRG